MPWLDRTGRLSPLKLATFLALLLPGLWVGYAFWAGLLGPKPVTEAIHQTGIWAVRLLLLSLAVTPLRRLAAWNKLLSVRRMLGVAVLAYGVIHLTLYIASQQYDLIHVASEIALRFYLTIGFVALLGFAALGATSTDAMIRRLGAARWNRLHQLVYLLGALAIWHFLLQAKLDVTQPVLMAGLFLWLMGFRLLNRLRVADKLGALVGLAIGAALLTAGLEAGWYQVVNHVPASRVLPANLSLVIGVRPAWWVLLAGSVAVALRLLRPLWARRPPPSARPSAVRAAI